MRRNIHVLYFSYIIAVSSRNLCHINNENYLMCEGFIILIGRSSATTKQLQHAQSSQHCRLDRGFTLLLLSDGNFNYCLFNSTDLTNYDIGDPLKFHLCERQFFNYQKIYVRYNVNLTKLDGVGPVDNRPSTDQLHHFVHFLLRIFFLFLFFI